MKKILLFITVLVSGSIMGQEVDPYKFTSMVDLYEFPTVGATGNLDAQIPLYTINTRGLELPLSLSYDQMGNSNVFYVGNQFGDAWIPNAIGTISREISDERSVSDGSVSGAVMCGGMVYSSFSARKFKIGPYVPDELYYQNNSSTQYRLSPDHYTFSFMGLSGKFTIYNDNGVLKPQLLESSDFAKIEVVQPASWELINTIYIYDKNGYKYKFSSPSNINQNNYFETVYLTTPVTVPMGCSFTITVNHTRALVPNDQLLLKDFVISRQIFTDGKPFWRNLELTEIYDKDNVLLVSYEYDTIGMGNGDSANRWVNGIGLNQTSQKLFLKKINIINQGNITFNNVLGTNGFNVVNSYTSSIEVKDLKNNLIKKFSFDYTVKGIHNIKYIKDFKDGSYGLSFNKRLLSGVKEYENTSQKFLQTAVEYKDAVITNTNVVVDRYGFLTKAGYCYPEKHLSMNDYRADAFLLQKIKYPTGGATVYKFEPNTFSHSSFITDFKDVNYDNHIYENLPLTQVSTGVTFTANAGDTIYLLNKSTSTSLYLYKTVSGTDQIVLSSVKNKDGQNFLTEDHCKHLYTKVVLPASDNNKYRLKYSSGNTGTSSIKVYRLNYSDTYQNFGYTEGNRIAKIGYFKENVNKTILGTPAGEATAEKLITFDYSDQSEANTSSGRVRSLNNGSQQMRPFHIIYDQVTTTISGIGKQYSKYNFPYNSTWEESIRTDINESKLYNVSNELLSESNYTYTYAILPFHLTAFTDHPKPFIKSSTVNTKNYEGTSFTTSTVSNIFDTTNRQLISKSSEDALGKTTKSEFDYTLKGKVWANTQTRNYIDNSLSEQALYTYDTAGNTVKTEFKTPDMTAYEQTGMVNPHYYNGLLLGYTQLDGTFVTLIYAYNDTQLVAKLVNSNPTIYYSSTHAGLRNNIANYSNQNSTTYNEANLKTTLNSLRTTFPDALITTYTYKPMVGISSITDENGKTTTYEYDTFNRLKTVKDHSGNILKEYQYNFTN